MSTRLLPSALSPAAAEEKIDCRARPAMSQSNGLRVTMGEGVVRSFVVNHNRDLKSKEEKIDRGSRLRGTTGEGEPVGSIVVIVIVI